MPSRIGRKRTVTYNGRTYKIRSDKIEIPDLAAMNEFAALTWLIQHTYPRGRSTAKPKHGPDADGAARHTRRSAALEKVDH